MAREKFTESTHADQPLRVDEEAGVIFGVKCLGRESKNGRIYTDPSLDDALNLYAECDVNVDHLPADAELGARPMRDGFGVLRNPSKTSEGVFADLHYLTNHPYAPLIVEKAKKFPKSFGMSHVALGDVTQGEDGVFTVESLEAVESVDIVSKPATVAGLFESERGPDMATSSKGKSAEKSSVRKLLEKNKTNPHAAAFLVLFEEDGMAPTADLPVEMPASEDAGPSADDEIKKAIKSMIMGAVDDPKLDAKATLKQIAKFLKSQEALLADAGDKSDSTPPEEPPAGGAVAESLRSENAMLKQQIAVVNALSTHGVDRSMLSESQIKVLDRCTTAEDVNALVEACGIKAGSREKPAVGPKHLKEEAGDPDYVEKQLAKRRKLVAR